MIFLVLSEALKKLESSSHWGVEVRALLSAGICPPRNGQDAGDHPPITPMKLASKELLDSDSWNIYDYIVRHFIGSVGSKYLPLDEMCPNM